MSRLCYPTLIRAWWVHWVTAVSPLATLFSPKAADRLVCAHVPDGEAEEDPMPKPRRGRGHPSGHPESRAAGHPGAAEDWVSRVSRDRALSREAVRVLQRPVYKSQEAPASHGRGWDVGSWNCMDSRPQTGARGEPRSFLDLGSEFPPAAQARTELMWRSLNRPTRGPSRRRPLVCFQLLSWPPPSRAQPSNMSVCLFIVVV